MSSARYPLDPLVEVMDRLLGPGGCPWDKEQDHRSLAPYVVEEASEVVAAIDSGDPLKLRDELGDLLLQVVFHASLASRKGAFDANDVVEAIAAKMVRRHPHVFAGARADTPSAVLRQWEVIKQAERGEGAADPSALARNTRILGLLFDIARRRGKAEEAALRMAMAALLAGSEGQKGN